MRRLIGWVGVLVALLVAACTPEPSAVAEPPEPEAVEPAVVDRGAIVAVVTVDGTVSATPAFVVPAEERGAAFHRGWASGDEVEAGDVVAVQEGVELASPVDGFFAEWLAPDAVAVHAGVPVATLRYAGFGVTASVPVEEAYRMYEQPGSARVQVEGGPGPTDCEPLPVASTGEGESPPETDAGPGQSELAELSVLCALPADVRVHPGSPAVLALNTAERTDVLRLPVQAVAGEDGHGTVSRLTGGEAELVEVTLGVTDGVHVEIVDGLAEGDRVLPYGPDLRPRVDLG